MRWMARRLHRTRRCFIITTTERSPTWRRRPGLPTTAGDLDNDGWPDIAVTNYGKNRLYRNNHDGTFTDVAEKAGITLGNWSSGVTWGDYDGDGKLDLFISGYIHFDREHLPISGSKDMN